MAKINTYKIKALLKKKNLTRLQFSYEMGFKGDGFMQNLMSTKSTRLSTLIRVAEYFKKFNSNEFVLFQYSRYCETW